MLVTLSSNPLPGRSVTSLIAGTPTNAAGSTVITELGPSSASVTQQARKILTHNTVRNDSTSSLFTSQPTVTSLTSPQTSVASFNFSSRASTTYFPRPRKVSFPESSSSVFSPPVDDQKGGFYIRARSRSAAALCTTSTLGMYSQSPVEDSGVTVNAEAYEMLQRHASSSQGSTSASASVPGQTKKTPVRMVGRGGQGSRPRRAKTPPINTRAPRDQISSPPGPSVRNAVHPQTSVLATSEERKTGVRVVGRGGFGSKRRVPISNDGSSLPPQSASTSAAHHPVIRPSAGPSGTIRVSGRGGAGSRPRPPTIASSSSGIKPKMQMIRMKWKGRKKSMPNMVITGSDSPVSTSSPMLFTHTRANTLPIDATLHYPSSSTLSKHDSNRPLPPIPNTSAHTSTVELSSTYSTTNTSLSVFVHSSDSHPSAPASSRGRRNTGSKLERTLGDPVPTTLLFSTGGNRSFDTHASSANPSTAFPKRRRSKSRRRASISLSSLGSFMRLPRESSSLFHGHSSRKPEQDDRSQWDDGGSMYDDNNADCWVENKFDSQSRDGAVTPVSPMIFSDRPESPKPPKENISNGDGDDVETSSAASYLGIHEDSQTAEERETFDDDESILRTPPTSSDFAPLTPHSFADSQSEILSPIVFSSRPVSMFMPSSSGQEDKSISPEDELDIPGLQSRRSQQFNTPRFKSRLITPETSFDSFGRPDSPFVDTLLPLRSMRAGVLDERPGSPATQRSESSQGWSGEWNRRDLRDVIESLRELR